jgi:hypothetical protein
VIDMAGGMQFERFDVKAKIEFRDSEGTVLEIKDITFQSNVYSKNNKMYFIVNQE